MSEERGQEMEVGIGNCDCVTRLNAFHFAASLQYFNYVKFVMFVAFVVVVAADAVVVVVAVAVQMSAAN